MPKDSAFTHIHMHASHHADLFEEFCHPPSSGAHPSSTATGAYNSVGPGGVGSGNNPDGVDASGDPSMISVPGHFLPFEEIQLPPHLMPVNPEDEDDVVPDMHAAFGIQQALGQTAMSEARGEVSGRGVHQEPAWRDLGLERLTAGVDGRGGASGMTTAARREGKKTGVLQLR